MSSPPDLCPFCLQFAHLQAARADGVRYCPTCGADWQAIDAPVPPRVSAELPALYDEPPPPAGSGVAPMTVGLLVGLAGTLGVALTLQWLAQPEPGALPLRDPAAVAPVAPPPAPVIPAPAIPAPVAPPSVAPLAPLPSPAESPARRAEAVRAALDQLRAALPPAAILALSVEIEGPVAFLRGEVDSARTLEQASATVGAVFGIKAVDIRGIRTVFREHTVRPGDSLASLARRYYGAGTAWRRILAANPDLPEDPGGLPVGAVLRIPTQPQP